MKAIMMSIKPQHVANILNGLKTLEIRKRFPSDYVGWVYIYCTKKDSLGRIKDLPHDRYFVDCVETPEDFEKMDSGYDGKGKVVARFWCDNVEEIATSEDRFKEFMFYETSLDMEDLLKQSCLDYNELDNYLYGEKGIAIHITKLEIFDKPREISEFSSKIEKTCICFNQFVAEGTRKIPLTRAPESWCYVEI